MVYACCTQERPYNWHLDLFECIKAQVRLGEKYCTPQAASAAPAAPLKPYINFMCHVFMFLDRFYLTSTKLLP